MTHPFAGLSGGSDILSNNDREKENLDPEVEDYPSRLIEDYTLKTLRDNEEIWYYNEKRGIFMPTNLQTVKSMLNRDDRRSRFDNLLKSECINVCMLY